MLLKLSSVVSCYLYSGSAITVGLMGVAFFANIHHLWYFIIVQLFGGLFQVSTVNLLQWNLSITDILRTT